jgi:hypothetical protein
MPNPLAFMRTRWRGEVGLRRLVWLDMAAVGTLVNLFASFGALMLAAQGATSGAAVAVHFAPMPYNLFIVAAIWRAPGCSSAQRIVAGAWLALMTLV